MGFPMQSQQFADADLVDSSVIAGLADIMPGAALRDLVADMLGDAKQRLARIAQSNCAPDLLRQIERDAHDLKSMGGNFGLTGLSQSAAQVERAARSGAIDSVRAQVPPMLEIGRQSIDAVIAQYEINPQEFQ